MTDRFYIRKHMATPSRDKWLDPIDSYCDDCGHVPEMCSCEELPENNND